MPLRKFLMTHLQENCSDKNFKTVFAHNFYTFLSYAHGDYKKQRPLSSQWQTDKK